MRCGHIVIMEPTDDLGLYQEIRVELRARHAVLPDGRRIESRHYIRVGRVRMPFGKYKGVKLENVPTDSLLWLVNNMRNQGGIVQTIRHFLEDQGVQVD